MLYVIDSSKSNEKIGKLKGWLEFHIDEAFKAAEITDSDFQCEFFTSERKSNYYLNFQICLVIFVSN